MRQREDKCRPMGKFAGREILHRQRISGTAIGLINVHAREEWQNRLNEAVQPFSERLNDLKYELSVLGFSP